MSAGRQGAVIAISSHVARGGVGNRVMVFALERLGFPVWSVPTVLLPYHPGHGPGTRIVPDDGQFEALLGDLADSGRLNDVAGIISGYFASPAQAGAVAELVRRMKAVRPDALYLCDPVIGDDGRLYVTEAIAAAIRDELLPLADVATPNAFECAWLAGVDSAAKDLAALAANLAPPAVLITSAPSLMRGYIGNLLVEGGMVTLLEHPAAPTSAKGSGDALAAMLLARRLEGRDWVQAAEKALSSLSEILAATARTGADKLMMGAFQDAIIAPRAPVSLRRML